MIDMKKIKIIITILMFGLAFVSHFAYEFFPNTIFSILFPVNESIWEHMKLIATPILLMAIIEYIIYKKKEIQVENFLLAYGISVILGIIIYLVLYLPLEIILGHSLWMAILLLLIIYGFIGFSSFYIINYKGIRYGKLIGLGLIILLYGLFGLWTYKPPINKLFLDTQKNIYGIKK